MTTFDVAERLQRISARTRARWRFYKALIEATHLDRMSDDSFQDFMNDLENVRAMYALPGSTLPPGDDTKGKS